MLRLRCKFGSLEARNFVRASCLVLLTSVFLFSAGSLFSLRIPGMFPAGSILKATPSFSPPVPTQSSPIAITHNGQFVVNVNPDANSITVVHPLPHRLQKQKEIAVGREPTSIAASPDN